MLFSRKISIGAQNCQLIHAAELSGGGMSWCSISFIVNATEVCIFLEVEHCGVLSHVHCKCYLQVKTATHSVSC